MKFPEKVFTHEELEKARRFIEEGNKHRLIVIGSSQFKEKVKKVLSLIRTAKYYEFLRTYIRRIIEVNGFSQLREADASIWVNKYTFEDSIEAAGYIIQKTEQMKNYIEGKPYFGGVEEAKTVKKRIQFLEDLKKRSKHKEIKERCEKNLKLWAESRFL